MGLYQLVDGEWVFCERAFIKKQGVWVSVKEAHVRSGGDFVKAYDSDKTPPSPPEITLSVVEAFSFTADNKDEGDAKQRHLETRYITVGVRIPGASNDPDVRRVRVLTTFGGLPPNSVYGGTENNTPDRTWPKEPWKEWRYNDYGEHHDTSNYTFKQFPVNATASTTIAGDKDYYFTGWTQDDSGNWSVATEAKIHIAKDNVNMPHIIIKEARFQPNSSGSWTNSGFQSGKLIQQKSPRSQGLWFYGNQFTDSIGAQTSNKESITVRSAQIYVIREDDGGPSNSDLYLFWTPDGKPADLPPSGASLEKYEPTRIGALAKGQAKWFELPASFKNNLNKQILGLGLDWKDPAKGDASATDFSIVTSTGGNLRCGEVHVVWEEQL